MRTENEGPAVSLQNRRSCAGGLAADPVGVIPRQFFDNQEDGDPCPGGWSKAPGCGRAGIESGRGRARPRIAILGIDRPRSDGHKGAGAPKDLLMPTRPPTQALATLALGLRADGFSPFTPRSSHRGAFSRYPFSPRAEGFDTPARTSCRGVSFTLSSPCGEGALHPISVVLGFLRPTGARPGQRIRERIT
jgi:hypothetical protein